MQPEPVSPELVLIDPELARRERARLEERAYLKCVHDMAPLRRALENLPPPVEEIARRRPWRDAATFSRRRLVPAVLLSSLLVNGFFVAELVARKGEEATQVAVRMVTLTQTPSSVNAPTVPPTFAASTQARKTRLSTKVSAAAKVSAAKGAVERKIVSLILLAPARKLPRAFIDPTTGLVKNNVQVVCKSRKHRAFLCAVRAPSQASKALYVRYRTGKNGDGVFTWYGYRRS